MWVRGKAKIKPIALFTIAISSARLGFGLWLELGQGKVRHIGGLGVGLRLNH